MKTWPDKKQKLKKITLLSLLLYLAALFLLMIIFIKFLKLARLPQPTLVSQFQPEGKAPTCLQQVDESGQTIKDNQVRTFPHCLTVTNSRFGSRLNLDWFSSQQKVTSSVLGNQEDQNTHFTSKIKDNNKIEPIFPLVSNSSFPKQSVDLSLTSQKINFANENFLVSLNIISPFSPSKSVEDVNAKISHAPLFYLKL